MCRCFRKLKKKVKRVVTPAHKPVGNYNGFGEGRDFVPRLGVIVPHNKKAQGAETTDGVYTEYRYALMEWMSLNYPRETRDKGGVSGAAKRLKAQGCNFSIEPHKNAYNEVVRGHEVLVLEGDKLSIKYAKQLVDMFGGEFPLSPNRGVKELVRGDRGYYNLVRAKKAGMEVALLTELFFIDNKEDFIPVDDMEAFWRNTYLPNLR